MAEINTTWTYNGQEFMLDMNDLDDLRRYDAAKKAQRPALNIDQTEVTPVIEYCEGMRRMFDTLFGEGTAEKLLGDTKKTTDYDSVYESFNDFLFAQTKDIAENRKKMLNKYKPNREQRRILEKSK